MKQIAFLLKSMNESFKERRNNIVTMDSEYHLAVLLADDLRKLPERQRQIARHEIQSVIFKHQINIFVSNHQALPNYNSVSQLSQQLYYGSLS